MRTRVFTLLRMLMSETVRANDAAKPVSSEEAAESVRAHEVIWPRFVASNCASLS
jgi:hypothetical protein